MWDRIATTPTPTGGVHSRFQQRCLPGVARVHPVGTIAAVAGQQASHRANGDESKNAGKESSMTMKTWFLSAATISRNAAARQADIPLADFGDAADDLGYG